MRLLCCLSRPFQCSDTHAKNPIVRAYVCPSILSVGPLSSTLAHTITPSHRPRSGTQLPLYTCILGEREEESGYLSSQAPADLLPPHNSSTEVKTLNGYLSLRVYSRENETERPCVSYVAPALTPPTARARSVIAVVPSFSMTLWVRGLHPLAAVAGSGRMRGSLLDF